MIDKKKLQVNNQGSTLVMVLIIMALLTMLASIALWVALNNYQMKVTNRKTTDSFYSAEEVLEQIKAGLEVQMSSAMNDAYYEVMQQYESMTQDEREALFANQYIYHLRALIKYGSSDDETLVGDYYCDLSTLKSYVGSALLADGAVLVISDANGSGGETYCTMSTSDTGVTIKGLQVEYTDPSGYLSIISTDISIAIPAMNMTEAQNLPDLFTFPLIGNAGVAFGDANGGAGAIGTTVVGSVYAGSANALSSASSDFTSLVINSNATVTFGDEEDDYLIIADGDVTTGITTSGYSLATSATTELWARNVSIQGSILDLAGDTYVSDDMTISGTNASVTFGTDGSASYVGYGQYDEDADLTLEESTSAILINGTGATLDLSGLSKLILTGYSYLSTGSISSSGTTITNSDVQMASSITVKGEQIAYLLPAECIGTDASHNTLYNKNPMTYTEYNTVITGDYTLVDEEVTIKRTGKTLSEYLGSQSVSDAYQTVFVPDSSAADGKGYVYFYLALEDITSYFLDFYNESDANADKLTKYTAFYTQAIQSTEDSASIYTAGLYTIYENSTLSYEQGSDSVDLTALATYNNNLTAILQKSGATELQLESTVFDNLVDESTLTSFLSGCAAKTFTTVDSSTGTGIILIDNASGSALTVSNSTLSGASQYFVIATGDVTVNAGFTGTIIAKGKITVTGGANIAIAMGDDATMRAMLRTECTDINGTTTIYVYDCLEGGSAYLTTGSVDKETGAQEITLSEYITYANWQKK